MASSRRKLVRIESRKVAVALLLIASVCACLSNAQTLPRGVSRALGSSYKPAETFTCLDGSKTISFDWINDDHCDCKDGSDEPGTAACPKGKFYCVNKGFKPETIPASRVSDGFCDCCDGSDEYEQKVNCPDTCMEMGKAMREELAHMRALVEEGHRIRSEYSEQGKKAKEEQQALLVTLGPQRDTLSQLRDDLQVNKDTAEAPEKEAKEAHENAWKEEQAKIEAENDNQRARAAFADLDVDSDGLLVVSEILLRGEFDKDKDGSITEEEAKEYLGGYESVDIDTFISSAWSVTKDKYAPPTPEQPDPIETPPVDEPEAEHDDEDEDDDSDFEEDDFEDDGDNSSEDVLDNTMPPYPEETRKLMEAADLVREEFNKVDKDYAEVNKQIQDIEKFLTMDMGPDDVFYPLKSECFEYTDREYTYKVCPFDRASQRPKTGGSETSLGSFKEWHETGGDKYKYMKFEKGLHCWNGPDRSATVKLLCGKENILSSAAEPNRCEYTFDLTTPAACEELLNQEHDHHDEL